MKAKPKSKAEKEVKKLVDDKLGILRALFVDYVKFETLNGEEIEIIVFFDDTLKNLKPIFDKYDAVLDFDKKDEDTKLHYYIPFMDFYNTFEPVLAVDLSMDDILLAMIAYDKEQNFGHGMFLNMINDIRNPKTLEAEDVPFEPLVKQRRIYY